jgi:hypothetical protein
MSGGNLRRSPRENFDTVVVERAVSTEAVLKRF